MGGFVGVLMFALCFFAGKLLVYLGYGKKGYKALIALEGELPKIPCIIFSILFFIWGFFGVFFYFAVHNSADADTCLGIIIGGLVIYGLWFVYARGSVPGLLQQLEKVQRLKAADKKGADAKELGVLPQREAQPGDWQCTCGRVNAKYISTCPCGINRREIENASAK